jgi:hexokinase
MSQKAIDIGILETWTKDFDCPDAVGKNAAQLLQEAISRRNDLNINIVAILNDATGTLVQGVYLDPECAISMILGTGSNACYLEKVERIEKWTERELQFNDVKEVIIDMECGAFGDNGVIDFVRTEFDKELDQESLFPNSFT